MKHASFFSGVGGLDLGFERAGIHTVSVCEIDPYASSVLAERFPSAPNLGSITEVQADDIPESDIWSGGFPCQDLSVAGKRAGFSGKRSSLAFTFLDLVEQRRPRWIVLENVPGLFSSNEGADFARLLYEMEQLGYGVAWRTLDARYFGVAQRRRRVFIVGSLGTDRAGEVLLECEGCEWHPATSDATWQGAAQGAPDGSGVASTIRSSLGKQGERGDGSDALIVGASADADGMRATDGVARRVDDQSVVAYQTRVDEKNDNFSIAQVNQANSLSALWPADTSHRSMTLIGTIQDARPMPKKVQNGSGVSEEDIAYTLTRVDQQAVAVQPLVDTFGATTHRALQARDWKVGVSNQDIGQEGYLVGVPAVFRKSARAQTNEDSETWVEDGVANTINTFDVGDTRTTHIAIGGSVEDDPLLPIGLDSHRYRCCGNGVVANVAEWIGRRIVEADRRWREEDK